MSALGISLYNPARYSFPFELINTLTFDPLSSSIHVIFPCNSTDSPVLALYPLTVVSTISVSYTHLTLPTTSRV